MGITVKLYELQKCEEKISGIQAETQKIKNAIETLLQDFEARKNEILDAPKNLAVVQAELTEKNLELSALLEKQKSHQSKISGGKRSSKEYARFDAEKKAFEKQKSGSEEQILLLMNRQEEVKKLAASKDSDLEEIKRETDAQIQEKTQVLEGLNALLSERQKEKEALSSQIPEDALKQFRWLYENMEGLAVTEVDEEACIGCSMGLSTSVVDRVKNHDGISCCDSCGRILYSPQAV